MSQEIKNFENEEYSVEAAEKPGCCLFLRIFAKPKAAQKSYRQAVKKVNKQISIPGFRKGHAPDRTVISRYSSYVEQEWKDILVNDAYHAAIDLTKVYPINKESIQKPKIESCSQEEGAVVSIAYEHYPFVPYVDFSEIKLASIAPVAIEDTKIEEILAEVRKAHADWENIEGRAVEENDFVDVSIDSLEEETPKQIVNDRRFEVHEKKLTPWLAQLLIGMQIGESREGESALDPNAEESVKQGFKPTKVRVTLNGIKKIILPELDEALAKKAGAPSLDDLRKKILHNLEKEAAEEARSKKIQALEKALLEKYPFDVPNSIAVSEREQRLSKRLQALKNERLADEEIQQRQTEIEREIDSELDHDLRLYFLNKQIAKQGKISLSNQELNDELVRYMSQNPYLYGKENDESATRELVSRMANVLMQRKTKEYALAQIEAA